ncbi:MAG: flagellar biosynthetic protein FliR [Candidatus Margulisiibacteriota bacterium]|jgi:flagellar biosynthetic protein FliR
MIITLSQVAVFFLIFARIAGLFQFSPVFNTKEIFLLGKTVLIFWISFSMVFVIPLPVALPDTALSFALALVTEVLVGACIGFVSQLLLIGLEFAGSMMDTQAGLSTASILDPSSGRTTTLLSKWVHWIAIIVFLMMDGHHMLLGSIFHSFKLIPIGAPVHFEKSAELLMSMGTMIFQIALQYSASILLIVFLIDFCFGMLSRVAPQINVFQLGFQVKPIISIFIFGLITIGLVESMATLMEQITEYTLHLMMLIKP